MPGEPKIPAAPKSSLVMPAVTPGDAASTASFKEWLNTNARLLDDTQSEALVKFFGAHPDILKQDTLSTDDISRLKEVIDGPATKSGSSSGLAALTPSVPATKPTGRSRSGSAPASSATSAPAAPLPVAAKSPDTVPSSLSHEQIARVNEALGKLQAQEAAYTAAKEEVGAGDTKGKWRSIMRPYDASVFQSYYMALGKLKHRGELLVAAGDVGNTNDLRSFLESTDTVIWDGEQVLHALNEYRGLTSAPTEDKMEKFKDLRERLEKLRVTPPKPVVPPTPPKPPTPPVPPGPVPPPTPLDKVKLKEGVQEDIDRKKAWKESRDEYESILQSKTYRYSGLLRRFGLDPSGAEKAKQKMQTAKAVYASDLQQRLVAHAEKQTKARIDTKTGEAVSSTRARLTEIAYDGKGDDKKEQAQIKLIDEAYRPYFVQRFIIDDARRRLEQQKEFLSPKAKRRFVGLSEHFKEHKWKYRALVIGGAVVVVSAGTFLAGAGLVAALGAGAAAGGKKALRMAVGIGAGSTAGAYTYKDQTAKVDSSKKHLERSKLNVQQTSYTDLLKNLDQMTDDMTTDVGNVSKAERARMRNTLIAAGVTGFIAGAGSEAVAGVIDLNLNPVDQAYDDAPLRTVEHNLGYETPGVADVSDELKYPGEMYPNEATYVNNLNVSEPYPDAPIRVVEHGLGVPENVSREAITHVDSTQAATESTESTNERVLGVEEIMTPQAGENINNQIAANQAEQIISPFSNPPEVTTSVLENQNVPLEAGPSVLSEMPDWGTQVMPDSNDLVEMPAAEAAVAQAQADAIEAAAAAEAAAEIQNLVPNPEQILTVPQDCTVSDALFNAFKAGELNGLPEDMSRTEFLNKMYEAIHALDNNPAVMERMGMESGDLDMIRAGGSFDAAPIIEYMNGHSVEAIETGLYEPDQALERGTVSESPAVDQMRPQVRPETLAGDVDTVDQMRPQVRPESWTAEAAVVPTPEDVVQPAPLADSETTPQSETVSPVTLEQFQARMVEGFTSEQATKSYMVEAGLASSEADISSVALHADGSLLAVSAAEGSFITHPAVEGDLSRIYLHPDGSLLSAYAAEGSSFTHPAVEGDLSRIELHPDGSLRDAAAVEGSSFTHPAVEGDLSSMYLFPDGSLLAAYQTEGSSFTHPMVDGNLTYLNLNPDGSVKDFTLATPAEIAPEVEGAAASEIAPAAPTTASEAALSGNFESMASPYYGDVFGEGVQIPLEYKLALETELNEWATENNITNQAELSNHLEAMMMRNEIMRNYFEETSTNNLNLSLEDYNNWERFPDGRLKMDAIIDSPYYLGFSDRFIISPLQSLGNFENVQNLRTAFIDLYQPGMSRGDMLMELIKREGLHMEAGRIVSPDNN